MFSDIHILIAVATAVLILVLGACQPIEVAPSSTTAPAVPTASAESDLGLADSGNTLPDAEPDLEIATFAGGCFWCTESDLQKLDGVQDVISGFSGGAELNPSYKEVASGKTTHTEAVQITFDPSIITYEQLLDVFWKHHDPTDGGGQFVDRGKQYRPAIFFHNEQQKTTAEKSKEELQASGRFDKPIATEIVQYDSFFKAEEYHQDYYIKNPTKYKLYRWGSGRDQFIQEVWGDELKTIKPKIESSSSTNDAPEGDADAQTNIQDEFWKSFVKPSKEKLKELLTPLQFKVTQQDGTERAYENEYWDNEEEGIYVDIVSGEPLFSSTDKYDSGTGWPSFTKPLQPDNIVTKTDFKLLYPRTEVRSKHGDSHLGHVFKDGPAPTGLRYCMNSAALKFIPKDQLEEKGYGKYLNLFE